MARGGGDGKHGDGKHSVVRVGEYARGGPVRSVEPDRGYPSQRKSRAEVDPWMSEYAGKTDMPGRVYKRKHMKMMKKLRDMGEDS